MERVCRSLVLVLLAVIGFAGEVRGQQLIARVGTFEGRAVELWSAPNLVAGGDELFLLTVPNTPRPWPVLVFQTPYHIVTSPPSSHPIDGLWTSYGATPPPHKDISLRPEWQFLSCQGGCDVPVAGMTRNFSDLNLYAEYGFDGMKNASWALANGYATVVLFNRHYHGRATNAVVGGAASVFVALRQLPFVGPIATLGRSQGGEISIHSLAFPGMPMALGASVSEGSWVDGRDVVRYAYEDLRRVQAPHLFEASRNFFNGFFNRLAAWLGPDVTHPAWLDLDREVIAGRLRTPILLMGGSDDAFAPISETEKFFDALRDRGKPAIKWVWENGPSQVATLPVQAIGHGILDRHYALKRGMLWRVFVIKQMPPAKVVQFRVPQDVDLVGVYREIAASVRDARSLENAWQVAELFGNPAILYTSTDPRVPSGFGHEVHAHLVRTILKNSLGSASTSSATRP